MMGRVYAACVCVCHVHGKTHLFQQDAPTPQLDTLKYTLPMINSLYPGQSRWWFVAVEHRGRYDHV